MASKADYLKRYLSKDKDDTSKKKRIRVKKQRNLAIHDDDVDFKSIAAREQDVGSDGDVDPEDAPLVCGELKDESVKRWKRWQPMESEKDDDLSPQRREVDQSPLRRRRHDSDDFSPPRRVPSPDLSPPRPTHGRQQRDLSPDRKTRKSRHSPDLLARRRRSPDLDPRRDLRRHSGSARGRQKSPEILQRGKRTQRHTPHIGGPSPDQSPTRNGQKRTRQSNENSPPRKLPANTRKTRHDSPDSDTSPPRKQRHDSTSPAPQPPARDDMSPPRRKRHSDDLSPSRMPQAPARLESGGGSRLSDGGGGGGGGGGELLMSSGARSGLQDAELLKKENALARDKQEKFFKGLDPETSGRHAETVYRDKRGRRVDPMEEEAKRAAEKEARREEDEQFMQWGRGVANVQAAQDKMADELYEMSKPLARYADDEDLERMLKAREREGDPMLAFIRKSRPQPPTATDKGSREKPRKTRPMYKKKFPANRFGLRPGYRWDGVDRSNGFEKALFARESNKKAISDEAYKWSVEDM